MNCVLPRLNVCKKLVYDLNGVLNVCMRYLCNSMNEGNFTHPGGTLDIPVAQHIRESIVEGLFEGT